MTTATLTFDATGPGTCSLAAADGDARPTKIVGPAVPFGVASGPSSDGSRYLFSGPPTNVDELIDVVADHDDDAVVGRLAEPFAVSDTQLDAIARIFDTTRGRDVLVETSEAVRTGFSIKASFDSFEELPDGTRQVDTWAAVHLGVVRRPAFTQASGLTLAASRQEGSTMTDTQAPAGPQVVELPTIDELAQRVAEFQEQASRSGRHPLDQYGSREHFTAAFQAASETDRTRMRAEFALVDQITTNNPGVMAPAWRTEIKANLDRRRPAIAAMGGSQGLPDGGMDVSWPYFDGDLDSIIAEQAAEKTELNSVRIDIKKDTASIKTAGVASDISYQLLMRGTPSYLAAYQGICEAAYARYSERQFELALLAEATAMDALPAAWDAAGLEAFKASLFEASVAVEDATGAPANVVLASTDIFLGLGGSPLPNAQYGTQNVAGTADSRTLRIELAGQTIVRAPFLTAKNVVVTNDLAAKFSEQGPMLATEEDVAKLGRDVAVWGMYVPAEVYFPGGVIKLVQP